MLALTLIQPMASAIVIAHPRAKRIENRPRNLPTKMRNVETVVAVHAGAKWDDEYAAIVRRILGEDWKRGDVPAGAIVGVMTLTGKVFTNSPSREWFSGPFGYEIKSAQAIPRPIPATGKLGFWRLTDSQEHELVESLELVAA